MVLNKINKEDYPFFGQKKNCKTKRNQECKNHLSIEIEAVKKLNQSGFTISPIALYIKRKSNYSAPNLAISARASITFCPDFITVSIIDRTMAAFSSLFSFKLTRYFLFDFYVSDSLLASIIIRRHIGIP